MWSWDCTPWLLAVLKYFLFSGFCPLWFLSFAAFVLWCFRPLWLFSVRPRDRMTRMLIVHKCCNVITWPEMGSYTLIVGVLKYFPLLVVLSALIFMLCSFCPMVLLSILAFLCPPTWSHEENVDCPHLYHVITWPEQIGSYTLIVGVLKYFLFWVFCPLWFYPLGAFVLWCFCPFFLLFSVRPRDRMTRMLIVHTCIMWSHEQKWDCTPWLLEY